MNNFIKLLKNIKQNSIKILEFIDTDLSYVDDYNFFRFFKLRQHNVKINDLIFNNDDIRFEIATLRYKNINDYICHNVFSNLINKHLLDTAGTYGDIDTKPSIYTNIIIQINTIKEYFNLNVNIDHLYNCKIVYNDKSNGKSIKLINLDEILSYNYKYLDNEYIKPVNIYIATYFYFIKMNLINVFDYFKHLNDNYINDLYTYKHNLYYLLDYTDFNVNCLDKLIEVKSNYNYKNDFFAILINYLKESNKIDICVFFELYFTLHHHISNKRSIIDKRFYIDNKLYLLLDHITKYHPNFTTDFLKLYNENKDHKVYKYICQLLYDCNKYNYDDLVYITNNHLDIIPYDERIHIIKSTSLSCFHNNYKKLILSNDLNKINFNVLLYFYLSESTNQYLVNDLLFHLECNFDNITNIKYIKILLDELKSNKKIKI